MVYILMIGCPWMSHFDYFRTSFMVDANIMTE